MTPIFPGKIENGKLLLDSKSDFIGHLHSMEGKRVEVTVEKSRRKRTVDQNSYYWLILDMISKETGQERLSLHQAFKFRFSGKITVKGLVIPQSSKALDTVDFSTYVENIKSWAREFLNMEMPDPEKVKI